MASYTTKAVVDHPSANEGMLEDNEGSEALCLLRLHTREHIGYFIWKQHLFSELNTQHYQISSQLFS